MLTEYIKIKVASEVKYYEKLGYYIPRYMNNQGKLVVKRGTEILVNVKDLPLGSNVKVHVLCDRCGVNISYKIYQNYLRDNKKSGLDSCDKCRRKNISNVIFKKYGVTSTLELDWVQEKMKKNNLKKYGVELFLQSSEVHAQIKKTVFDKYGVECITQVPEIKKKTRETYNKKYGVDSYAQTEEGRKRFTGKNNPRWKGGITKESKQIRNSIQYKEWRKAVFEKFDYTCCVCGQRGGRLHAHHVENFSDNPELRFNINNGAVLCDCHHFPNIIGSFHNIYGVNGNTREQLEEYINDYNNKDIHLKQQKVI